MTIRFPSHLTNIELVNQMYKMMSEFLANHALNIETDLEVLDQKAYDYVYDLIKVIFPDNDDPTNRYLANMFYECKGTTKIFELIEKYLGLVYKDDPFYNIDKLRLNFHSVSGSNINNFKPALTNFINALMYFHDLEIILNIFNLNITSDMSNRSSNMCICYKESYFEFK